MSAPETRPETRAEPRMAFAPLRGWIRNGPDYNQDFNGWIVYANKPHFNATPVTVTARALTTDEEGA